MHPHRSLLLKVLNGQPANDPDLTMVHLVGDRLLFCSDGLCGLVEDPVIEGLLKTRTPRRRSTAWSKRLARRAGSTTSRSSWPMSWTGPIPAPSSRWSLVPLLSAPSPWSQPRSKMRTTRTPSSPNGRSKLAPERPRPTMISIQPQTPSAALCPLAALVAAALAAAVLGGAYAWTRTQFFVGVAEDQVAIFRGLSDSLPGIKLSSVYEIQPLGVVDLPQYYQDKVRANIDVSNLSSAHQTVDELVEAAERCAASSGATGSRSPSSRPTRSPASPSVHGSGSPNPASQRCRGPARP